MNPNDIQHGGDHYKKAGSEQHWDSLWFCGFGWEYYLGRATAYLTRVKDTALDPSKALHCVDKLVHLVENGNVPAEFQTTKGTRLVCDGGRVPYGERVDVEGYLETRYFPANSIDPAGDEAAAIKQLMMARTLDDLRTAREPILRMVAAATPSAAPAPPPAGPAADAVAALAGTPTATALVGDAGPGYTNQDGPAILGAGIGGADSWAAGSGAETPPPTPKPRKSKT